MFVKKESLLNYMDGENKRFVIPPYQRNYDWKAKHWERLMSDIDLVITSKKSHFFGSFVSYKTNSFDKITDYSIIDGQQRLVTASLILVALFQCLRANLLKSEDPNIADKIYKQYLVNDGYTDDNIKYRLKPFRGDASAYRSIYNCDNTDEKQNLVKAYNFIKGRLIVMQQSAEKILEALSKFEIVDISLEDGKDDPQEVFETINSTGLPLTESDKIRNYIFMGISIDRQEILYDKQWKLIENNTNNAVDAFLMCFLEAKTGKNISKNNVFYEFKQYIEPIKQKQLKAGIQVEEVMTSVFSDMSHYSYLYSIFERKRTHNSHAIDTALFRLSLLKIEPLYPFLLNLFDKLQDKKIAENDLVDILEITESYILRQKIINGKFDKKVFSTCIKSLDSYDGTSLNYVEKFKAYLLSQNGVRKFPGDITFKENLKIKNIGEIKDLAMFILARLENPDDLELNVWDLIRTHEYTLEHIMPQQLTHDWEQDIKTREWASAEECHRTWINRLGNLTLTNYNSKYGNKPFIYKLTMNDGYASSSIKLNVELGMFNKWTSREMSQRSVSLADRAAKIWVYPRTTYKIPTETISRIDIGTNDSMAGKSIESFEFDGKKYICSKWVDMYLQVIRKMYETNDDIMNGLVDTDEKVLKGKFSEFKSNNSFVRISDDLWHNTQGSTDTKLQILRALFDKYGWAYSDLIINLDTSKVPDSIVRVNSIVKDENERMGVVRIIDSEDEKCYVQFDGEVDSEKFGYPDAFTSGILELVSN